MKLEKCYQELLNYQYLQGNLEELEEEFYVIIAA